MTQQVERSTEGDGPDNDQHGSDSHLIVPPAAECVATAMPGASISRRKAEIPDGGRLEVNKRGPLTRRRNTARWAIARQSADETLQHEAAEIGIPIKEVEDRESREVCGFRFGLQVQM